MPKAKADKDKSKKDDSKKDKKNPFPPKKKK